MKPLRGTLTALVTPFRDGAVDMKAFDGFVERQIEAGVDGLLVCGTSGEAATLTLAERRKLIGRTVELAAHAKIPVIAGAGSNATAESLDLVRMAADSGADALLVVTPYYSKPPQDGLLQHFSTLAESTDRPLILYNIPSRSCVELAPHTVKRLYEAHDNVVAIKDSSGEMSYAADVMAACKIDVLVGEDTLIAPLMGIGAAGAVSATANLVPKAVKRLTDAVSAGHCDQVRQAQRALYPVCRSLGGLETNPIPIKTALAIKGLCAEEFRLPLCPLSADKRQVLEAILAGIELD